MSMKKYDISIEIWGLSFIFEIGVAGTKSSKKIKKVSEIFLIIPGTKSGKIVKLNRVMCRNK